MDKKTISVTVRLGEENFNEYRRVLDLERAEFLRRNPNDEPPNDSRIVRTIFHKLAIAQGKQGNTRSNLRRLA